MLCRIFPIFLLCLAHTYQLMKRELRLFSIIVLLFSLASAQDYKLTGLVMDGNGNPIVFANVVLQTTDSLLIKGTSTDEKGFFQLENLQEGNYLLIASYIENKSEPLFVALNTDKDIGQLVIKENTQELDEVVVAYKKPTLEQKVDRLVFNIENTALSDSDIWSVLKRTPGVVVNQDELTIKGSSNISIMINGRLVNIPQSDIINLLSGSSASNVQSIEVITTPPAKYSAEGGLLIDIKMKKNLISGYNGSLYNRYTQGVFPKHTLGTDHFFKGKRTDFSVNYSYTNDKSLTRYTDITNFFDNNTVDETWSAEQSAVSRRNQHNINAFLDFELDDRNTLSLSTINSLTPSIDRFYDSETLITDVGGNLTSSFDTTNDSDYEIFNTSVYLDWVHKLKKKDAEISFNTHYTNYHYDRGQILNTDFFDAQGMSTGENDFTTQSGQKTGLFSIQMDYTTPLGQSSKLESGLRYANINSDNTISQEGFDRTQPGINPTESGVFTYDEEISAAYMSLNNSWENWKLQVGLRAEYTETIGFLDTEANATTNSYLEFFPSFALRHTLKTKHSFGLNYYRRITRPRYNRLNPFQYFQTNNSVVEGNPNLQPSTRNYGALEYTYDKTYNLIFFYGETKNQQLMQVFQDNDSNLLRFINTNLGLSKNFGADFSINKQIAEFWNTFFLVSYFYEQNVFTDLGSGAELTNDIWTGHIRATNSFTFLSDKSLFADFQLYLFLPYYKW